MTESDTNAILEDAIEMGVPLEEAFITEREALEAAGRALDEWVENDGQFAEGTSEEDQALMWAASEARVAREMLTEKMDAHRSLTDKEKAELKVPYKDLHCSVAHFDGKGFCAYTHRARTKYYKTVAEIPAEKLRFISSTS